MEVEESTKNTNLSKYALIFEIRVKEKDSDAVKYTILANIIAATLVIIYYGNTLFELHTYIHYIMI